MRRIYLLALSTLVLGAVPMFASVEYTLTADACSSGCGTPPYGTIDLIQNGANTVQLTVALASGYKFVDTGGHSGLAFNLIGNPTISATIPTGWSLNNSGVAGSIGNNAFGDFEYAFDCGACGPGASHSEPGPFTFDITASGLTPASFAELSTGGSLSAYFAVDVIAPGPNGNTGSVGANGPGVPSPVPEPADAVLLGTLMLGCGFLARRRYRFAGRK
ncbi:MAG: hypothetical protein ACRD22_10995 [Terriglobia bacterium]